MFFFHVETDFSVFVLNMFIMSCIIFFQGQLNLNLQDSSQPLSETIKSMLQMKMANSSMLKELEGQRSGTLASDLAIASMLTSLATQSRDTSPPVDTGQVTTVSAGDQQKDSNVKVIKIGQNRIIFSPEGRIEMQHCPAPEQPKHVRMDSGEGSFTMIKSEPVTMCSEDQNQRGEARPASSNISLSIEDSVGRMTQLVQKQKTFQTSVPSNDTELENQLMIISQLNNSASNNGGGQGTPDSAPSNVRIIEHNGKRYIIQTQEIDSEAGQASNQSESDDAVSVNRPLTSLQETVVMDTYTEMTSVSQEVMTTAAQHDLGMTNVSGTTGRPQPCPVCGDQISGRLHLQEISDADIR